METLQEKYDFLLDTIGEIDTRAHVLKALLKAINDAATGLSVDDIEGRDHLGFLIIGAEDYTRSLIGYMHDVQYSQVRHAADTAE